MSTDSAQERELPSPGSVATLLHAADSLPIVDLRDVSIPGALAQASFGRHADLMAHMEMLATEFTGRSLLEFAHAAVIVRIRREENLETSLARFHALWEAEADRLLEQLDSRWLVSACDTLIEHGRTETDRAFGLVGSLFMNTLKLTETEALLCGGRNPPDLSRLRSGEATPLFDGLTAFIPQGGDMIDNLERRLAHVEAEGFAARIVQELFQRARRHDTVVRRLAEMSSPPQPSLWICFRRRVKRWLRKGQRS